jgi:hypothetical protein
MYGTKVKTKWATNTFSYSSAKEQWECYIVKGGEFLKIWE